MRFGLLGPPVLFHDAREGGRGDAREGVRGEARIIASPKSRALLAVLLLDAGRVVSVESLKDALWGGAPPVSAQASLHNHITRLRRLLDDPGRLRTVPSGYVLRIDDGELDVHVFDAHVAEARAAHTGRDWRRVVRECAGALALWRGAPLAGLPPEVGGYAFAQRLCEARLLLLEWRYDAELALGGPRLHELVPELAALTVEYPLREVYHRQLMLALHRTGRQAEALAVHRELRTRLVGRLGIEPGPGVREAHVEVLRGAAGERGAKGPEDADGSSGDKHSRGANGSGGDKDSRGANGSGGPGRPDPSPAQLPPHPTHFIGRTAVRDALHRTLTAPDPHPTAVISGMAGVGKSALALHVAHQLAERFPDGQLHLDLHGATPGMTPLTPAQALTTLLRDLGTEPCRIPERPEDAAALLRSLLAPTRTLLVLDDAASAAQVRPLLPGGAGCGVIVTSRSPLAALDGAARFPLAPLSDEEGAELLRKASGREGLDGTDAARLLVELTGRLPLALRVVAARLAARRALTPDVLAGQLTAAEVRLHHLEYDDLSVRRSLAVAHDALAASEREADRDAARTLVRIGALDLPTYGAPLLARLAGTSEHRTEAALDRLLDVALLEETTYGRYAPHDLVRDFARERAGERGTATTADTALHWYAAVAERLLAAIVEPGPDRDDRRRPTPVQPGGHAAHVGTVAPFADADEAFAWGDRELENVVALAVRYADDPSGQRAGLVSTLVRLIFPYAHRRGRVAEMEVLGQAGLRVARRLGDAVAEAYALVDLAGLHLLTGRQNDALALNDRALAIWRRLDHPSWIRRCLNNRGLLLDGLGRHTEAGEALERSLEYARRLDDPYGEAVTHSHLGNLVEHTDPRAAIERHRRSLALGDAIGAVIVRHSAHCNIGYAHLRLGQPAAALPHFEESLRILGGHGDWHGESQTRLGLVRALRLLGHDGRAARECAELLRRAEARADHYTGGLARHQHGLLLRERGHIGEAREEWSSALAALEDTDEQAVVTELRELLECPV
ncbi:DNA-binding SARP family transcriptional activator/tetratricopeptide (TPR) repeat protein [Streptomyces luteogriseus]|uniref:DNA-binding SARP family transcriptional activator/tetratricopeptide (TPR) repeat protein n=1 Tax=Streptomyces luteogriseus TaxID=68233 RepID=A0A7W7GIN8_9ACTN|nr:BTAD domain-containing putative transcriptional regulator [Streptomyces luteogriseus]MBB4713568.1 DNA-binding SARP family transcriptional activator/tetratricopeptide (TPR) repeat protein [Streptomyces luteogriseus]